jgi:phosphatidylinositol alpha-mannosyltransferase/D-inositol-3-phosphate glycosyltransferase
MTRIALIPSSYPPALGGVEELTRHLALAQVAAGHVVEVWTTTQDDTGPPVTEEVDGITVRRFPFPLPAANARALLRFPFGAAKTIGLLRRAVRSFEPDLLHVQCFGPNGVYATALARLTGVPLVVTLQGETVMDDADIFETSASLRTGLRWAMRTASVVTGCSAYTLADAEKRFGLPIGRGVAVPNGVDLTALTALTALRHGHGHGHLAGSTGSTVRLRCGASRREEGLRPAPSGVRRRASRTAPARPGDRR